jgi:hypothetical protein
VIAEFVNCLKKPRQEEGQSDKKSRVGKASLLRSRYRLPPIGQLHIQRLVLSPSGIIVPSILIDTDTCIRCGEDGRLALR